MSAIDRQLMEEPIAMPIAAPPISMKVTHKKRRSSKVEWILVHIAFATIIVFFAAPFLWMVLAAFDGNAKAYIRWPQDLTLDNFKTIFQELDFGRSLVNSIFVATSTMILATITVSLAGYSLSRLKFRGTGVLV